MGGIYLPALLQSAEGAPDIMSDNDTPLPIEQHNSIVDHDRIGDLEKKIKELEFKVSLLTSPFREFAMLDFMDAVLWKREDQMAHSAKHYSDLTKTIVDWMIDPQKASKKWEEKMEARYAAWDEKDKRTHQIDRGDDDQ